MEFIHQPYVPGETIAAIATPPGEGGVAIIRISGKEALQVAKRVFSGPIERYQTHTAHYGQILDAEGGHVDDVLALIMRGNRSFTGEDTVEIHCHGGSLITRRVLDVILAAGARAALPGEFSFKAFMNGKLDLSQAEAIQELICAKNERALDAAENQLRGQLSQKVGLFQKQATEIAAILEAWVDFPEEGLEFATMDELEAQLDQMQQQIQKLVDTFHDGKILHDGIALALVGAPNAGKSSLMNALLDKERAIVSPTPGTTRDVLEGHLRLNGLNIKLMDTAGIRSAYDAIEQEGIKRTHLAMSEADLVLLILDATQPVSTEIAQLLQNLPQEKTIAVWNKIDLPHPPLPLLPIQHVARISAKERLGIEVLHKEIDDVIWKKGPPSREELVVTNVRHKEALQKAIQALDQVRQGLQANVSPEFLTIDMRGALIELGKILGTNVSEDILTAIFSKFCIGK